MNSRLVPVNASTSANATSVAGAGGNHRQKLDQIRSSLRPFEQKWYEEVEEDDERTLDDEEEDDEEEEDKDGKKAEMIRALMEAGYDQARNILEGESWISNTVFFSYSGPAGTISEAKKRQLLFRPLQNKAKNSPFFSLKILESGFYFSFPSKVVTIGEGLLLKNMVYKE